MFRSILSSLTNWQSPKPYRLNIRKFYKIWFSKDPDNFLGLENELRFIRMREKNKQADLAFIYSAKCLTKESINKLIVFCKKHRITPVDFDTVIPPLLQKKEDKLLYEIAQLEIARTISNNYGNLAAASDCARVIEEIVINYGAYSDYDVECNFSKLDSATIEIEAPVILNVEILPVVNSRLLISSNSDFLAFATENTQPERLHPDALSALKALQKCIIKNYSNPFTFSSIYLGPKEDVGGYEALENVFALFTDEGKRPISVFNFRGMTAQLPESSEGMQILKRRLEKLSVVAQSGPLVYIYLYSHLFPLGHDYPPLYYPENDPDWFPYLKMFHQSSAAHHKLIAGCVEIKNTCEQSRKVHGKIGEICDDSWNEEGARLKKVREAAMVRHGKNILNFWREGNTFHQNLLTEAKQICTAEYFSMLSKKQYSLILRKACSELNLPLVTLLLKYNGRIDLEINATSSNGNTPLDWAMNSPKEPSNNKQAICTRLIEAGAKTKKELQCSPRI